MKKIKVIVRDRNTLVLDEDASKGDYINLNELNEVDYSELENVINEGKDVIYNKKLEEYKHILNLENNEKMKDAKNDYEKKIEALNYQISTLNKDKEALLREKENEREKKFKEEIDKLNNEIRELKSSKSSDIELLKMKHTNELNSLKNNKDGEIKDLHNEISSLKVNSENALKLKESELNNLKNEELNKQKEKYENELREKDTKINEILRQKAALNVKQTGENLESWCNNEVISYMQNGLLNCTWKKDNKVIREDDEEKGSKADYIFKVFASNAHEDSELLTSVCLDMKDENPDSVNKKNNADYYKQLDKNRNKKECKYAVLVSNLEMDKPNDLPIFRVSEYKDMYVVRPAYLMTFLNLITSLTMRFAELIKTGKEAKINIKNAYDLNQEFENLKHTYLEKPLEALENQISDISSQSETIRKSANKITELCDKIINNYINSIQSKLSKFEININRSYRRNDIE